MPPEIIILNASSMVRLLSATSSDGTNSKKPVVGFGVVGIRTLQNSLSSKVFIRPVKKPIDLKPGLGNSTITTDLIDLLSGIDRVFITCFVAELGLISRDNVQVSVSV